MIPWSTSKAYLLHIMAKNKERSELEYLRALNRELKSEIRHLKKKAGRSNKKVKQYEATVELQADPEPEITEEHFQILKPRCPECQGELDIVDLVIKELAQCECGYRKTTNKPKK